MAKRQITLDEWDEYEWIEATSFADSEGAIFLRGKRITGPPDDGLKYVEQSLLGDTETRWVPALTYERTGR